MRPFQQIDVFADEPFRGNPLAVVVDADGLSSEKIQQFAHGLLTSGRSSAPFIASQGTRLERRGRARIERDADGTIWVGGATRTYIRGTIEM